MNLNRAKPNPVIIVHPVRALKNAPTNKIIGELKDIGYYMPWKTIRWLSSPNGNNLKAFLGTLPKPHLNQLAKWAE